MSIPSTKVVRDDSRVILCQTRRTSCGHPVSSETTDSISSYSTTVAVRQRVKPRFLSTTALVYTDVRSQPTIQFPCQKHDTGSNFRTGSHLYCHILARSTFVDSGGEDFGSAAAIQGALSRITGSLASYGESLGEIGQTSRMIANRIGSLISLARDIKRGNWKKIESQFGEAVRSLKSFRRSSKSLADAWLELSFGWRPFVDDIWTGVDLLSKKIDVGVDVESSFNTAPGGFGPRDSDGLSNVLRALKNGANTRARVKARVCNHRLAQLNALGLANPAEIAWNLLPFSFVVDWVLPIGPWLAALSATAGLCDVDISVTSERVSANTYLTLTCHPDVRNYKRTVWRKQGAGSFALPRMTPYRSDVRKVVTSAALLRQQFSR